MTTDYRAAEIDRVMTHETEVLTEGHTPSDPSFSIRLMGDHLSVVTAAYIGVTADELAEIRAILDRRATPPPRQTVVTIGSLPDFSLRYPLSEWVLYVIHGDLSSAYQEHPASSTI